LKLPQGRDANRERETIMARTNKHNQFFYNGLIITDSKVWINKSTTAPKEGQDLRISTLSIQLNGCLWINNVKVFEKASDPGTWYIKLPGSWLRTQRNPEGKPFDHVRMSPEQFATLRNYCYDRTDEALDAQESTESDEEDHSSED